MVKVFFWITRERFIGNSKVDQVDSEIALRTQAKNWDERSPILAMSPNWKLSIGTSQ